jgi:uncharacterized protein YggE
MKTGITKIKALLFFLFISALSQSQISGNQVYGNSSSNSNRSQKSQTITVNNNVISVSISILMNSKADGFVMTLGLNQEAETVKACNNQINTRIDGFMAKIKTLGVKKEDSYIDFISQTKVYDFSVEGTTAKQFERGFEIKKNIIINTKNISDLEKIITMASEYEIHDIIKVEYFNENSDKIHNALFDETLEMAETKKDKYLKSFRKKIVGTPDANELFEVYFPKNQYKVYQAYESAEIETNYNNRNVNYMKKLARKNKSFYYDGVSTASFDKVINPNQTEVGIQYTLTLTVHYKIDTSI